MKQLIEKQWRYRHSLVSAIIETCDGERVAEVYAATPDGGYRKVAEHICNTHNDAIEKGVE